MSLRRLFILLSILAFILSCERQTFRRNEIVENCGIMSIDEAQKEVELILSSLSIAKSTTSAGESLPANIPRTFENFGYSSGGTYNSAYNANQIISDLYTLHPAIIGGSEFRYTTIHTIFGIPISTEVTYSSGHAWLVDGMIVLSRNVDEFDYEWNYIGSFTEYQHYFRCKFGWNGGIFDGYYLAESNIFDLLSGPTYYSNYTETKTTEGSNLVFRYNLHSITGIRL